MAKQGYPGLVLVPPSDRWLIRRRLARWALPIIVVVWGASASGVWVPSSNNDGDCQPGIGQEVSVEFQKECDDSGQFKNQAQSRSGEFTALATSQDKSLAGSHSSMSALRRDQLSARQYTDRKSRIDPYGPTGRPANRAISTLPGNGSRGSRGIKKPTSNPNSDARLAERGDAFAQYRLGRFYAQLNGPNAPESVSWYLKASEGLQRLAEAGNGEAMYVLGVMYAFGRGVERDRAQARLWLTQAVDQQVSAAQRVLARLDGHRSADPR